MAVVSASTICLSLTACSTDPNTKDSKTSTSHAKTDVDLDVFILPDPKKKSKAEIIKQYMKNGKASNNWKDYNKAAEVAHDLNDYISAEVLLNQSLKLNPNVASTYYKRGNAKYNSFHDRNESAKKDLDKAIKLGEDDEECFQMLADIYAVEKKPDKAIQVLNQGINKCKKKTRLYHTRASIYLTEGKEALAIKDYSAAIKVEPSYVKGYVVRGQLYEKLGEFEKALRDYSQVPKYPEDEVFESHVVSYKFKASLLSKLGRHKEAIEVLKTALKNHRDNDELLELLGEQQLKTEQYQGAVESFTRSINLDPKYARRAYEGRSKAYKKLGKEKLAESDFKKAKSMKNAPAEKQMYKMNRSK